jgi:DUF971 family protein
MNTLTPSQKKPINIEVDIKQGEVRITWGDGEVSHYSLESLRKQCPCATCGEQRKMQEDPLYVLPPTMVSISAKLDPEHPVEMVGNYALQFFWDDGHRTGIYTFGYLRNIAAA